VVSFRTKRCRFREYAKSGYHAGLRVALALLSLRADARNPSAAPDEMAVVVREPQTLDVTQARTAPADTAPSDATLNIVEGVVSDASGSFEHARSWYSDIKARGRGR
jgi:hypothetical protein